MLAGSAPVVRLKRELLAACITCPLCHKLIREATTISECLHSFCRKCIFSKLTDEVADCCPICHIDLGCLPEVKLRPDHNLEDVRAKIFPYKKRKANGSETLPSISLPVRRNERSPSSLVVNTPQMVALASLRTKSVARKTPTLHGPGLVIVKSKLKECYNDDVTDPSSTETVFKASHGTRQTSSDAETSNNKLGKGTENNPERSKPELWRPQSCILGAASRTNGLMSEKPNCPNEAR